MSTVAEPARPVGAYPSPARHGVCRLTLRIGNTEYRLRPAPPTTGILAEWVLRKISASHVAVYRVTAPKGQPARCTCPDHEESRWACKHIAALTAASLIPAPKPTTARGRQLHAQNARQAIQQAQAIIEAQRPAPSLPEGWQPGGAHPSFATGFRQAVAAHVSRLQRGGLEICDECGTEFDIQISGDPNFCLSCVAKGGAE